MRPSLFDDEDEALREYEHSQEDDEDGDGEADDDEREPTQDELDEMEEEVSNIGNVNPEDLKGFQLQEEPIEVRVASKAAQVYATVEHSPTSHSSLLEQFQSAHQELLKAQERYDSLECEVIGYIQKIMDSRATVETNRTNQ